MVSTAAVIINLGDVAWNEATRQNHPRKQAVPVDGWVTLSLDFASWPLVLIWVHVDALQEEKD
ncbi:DUF3302 domain-containing protein [Rhizobium mesosinicum]|uniref:DUF3302 domain-containing protein n=1 Tax=Rhizobium mesosinicum TaxID=335017 RepID=A0ABS7GXC6_9HYPH|nr:DUF3302 domain-containing protein [Rhizobium mesosinicum]